MFRKKKIAIVFEKGDRLVSIWEPNRVGKVVSISTSYDSEPVYTIRYKDGNEYANHASSFRRAR